MKKMNACVLGLGLALTLLLCACGSSSFYGKSVREESVEYEIVETENSAEKISDNIAEESEEYEALETENQDGNNSDSAYADEHCNPALSTIGPLQLGMSMEEVEQILPDIQDKNETSDGGNSYSTWFYHLSNTPGLLYDLELMFVAEQDEDSYELQEIFVETPLDWTTQKGIGIGSPEEDISSVYAGREIEVSEGETDGNTVYTYSLLFDTGSLTFGTENGIVTSIMLCGDYAQPSFEP